MGLVRSGRGLVGGLMVAAAHRTAPPRDTAPCPLRCRDVPSSVVRCGGPERNSIKQAFSPESIVLSGGLVHGKVWYGFGRGLAEVWYRYRMLK